MKISRSKLVALITGFISLIICIIYLAIVTVFDFRTFLNEQISSLSQNFAVIFFAIDNL